MNFTLSDFNSSVVDMWIAPFEDWHIEDESYQEEKLNFTW